ncbi:hypothetical protein [Sphingosinicella sp. YJ22]|uniref:hypothetical protein n=1 Tax=Sphingosinicella sp. YJ22 TaxID=1104780 RepID=UPI00140B2EAE|nr:hypothetical protein [Sphingosinicella sp. YJ22]
MTTSSREQVWNRIMAVQEEFNRLEDGFSAIPADRIGWWQKWRFRKSLDAMIEARGAHSHGELTHVSERRLPKLERAAKAHSSKLAKLRSALIEKA